MTNRALERSDLEERHFQAEQNGDYDLAYGLELSLKDLERSFECSRCLCENCRCDI